MKPVNEDDSEPKQLRSEIVKDITSEDLTINNDAIEKLGQVNEPQENNFTLYFDINKSLLFEDVPENEKILETYVSNFMNTNEEKDLKENCADEISRLEEKHINADNLYASLKVYSHEPKSAAVSPKEDINHKYTEGAQQINCTNQDKAGKECNRNISNSDRMPSSEKFISIEGNNNASSSTAKNIISVFTSASCSSTFTPTKKSIASSLKELSQNLKSKSPSVDAYSLTDDYTLENVHQEPSSSSENSSLTIDIQSNTLTKAQKCGTSGLKGKLKNNIKFKSPSDVTNGGLNDSILENINLKKDKGYTLSHFIGTKADTESLNSGSKRINKRSVKKATAKLKYSGNGDGVIDKQLRVTLTDCFTNKEEYLKLLKDKKNVSLEDSERTTTTSESCNENYNAEPKEKEDKHLVTEIINHANKTEGKAIESFKKGKRKLCMKESDLNQPIDENLRNRTSLVRKIGLKNFNAGHDNSNNKVITNCSQILNDDQRNIALKASDSLATKSTAKKAKSVRKNSSADTLDLESSETHESAPKKVSSIQGVSNETTSPDALLNSINFSQTEESGNISKNCKQNSDPVFLRSNKTSVTVLKDSEQSSLKESDTFGKGSSTPITLPQKQSPFMQLFSKFTENKSEHSEVKVFSAEADFINFLSGSCKMVSKSPRKKRQINEKSSPNLARLFGRKVNVQLLASDDDTDPSDLKTSKAERAQRLLAESPNKLISVDSTDNSPELPSLFSNKRSVSKKDKKIFKGFRKGVGNSTDGRKTLNSFPHVASSVTLNSREEFDSSSISIETNEKDNIEMKQESLNNVDENIDASYSEISKTESTKRSLSKSIAGSKASEILFPQSPSVESSSQLPYANNRSTPEKKLIQSTNSAGNIDCNLPLEKKKLNSLSSVVPSSNSVTTLDKRASNDLIMTDLDMNEIKLGPSNFSKAHDDIDKSLVETIKVRKKKLFKRNADKISETSALPSPCSQLSSLSTNNEGTSKKKQELHSSPKDSIINSFLVKKKKSDSFSSADVLHVENTLGGDSCSSILDVDAFRTESVDSNFLEAHDDIYPSATETSGAGRKKKSSAKSKGSEASIIPSPCFQLSCTNNRSSKKKQRRGTNSVESIKKSTPKKMKKVNSLSSVALSPSVKNLDNNLHMADVDTIEMESVQPNSSKVHDNIYAPTRGRRKKILAKCVTKTKILEHSSLVSDSLQSHSTSTDKKPLCKKGFKRHKNFKKGIIDDESTLKIRESNLSQSSNYFNRARESDNVVELNNSLPVKIANVKSFGIKSVGRNSCITPSLKEEMGYENSVLHSEEFESAAKDIAVLKKDSSVSEQSNFPSVKRRRCHSTHSTDIPEFDDSFQNSVIRSPTVSELSDVRSKTSRGNSSKEFARYIKSESSSSEHSLHRMTDTSEVQRKTSKQSSSVKHVPRQSARLRKRAQRLSSELSVSRNTRRKPWNSGSSHSALKFTKMQSSPEKTLNKSDLSHDLSLSFTSRPSNISNQNPLVNSIVPHGGFNQLVPVNAPVYYHPATNCLLISLSQSPQIVNQSIIPNMNQFNSQYQVPQMMPQMPFQFQNSSSNMISSLSSPAAPQNIVYPIYQANSVSQPTNFQCNNSFDSNANALSGLQRVSNNMSLNADYSSGNEIFMPKSFSAAQSSSVKLNAPNIIDIKTPSSKRSASSMTKVNALQTIILKDTHWTTTQNAPHAVNSLHKHNVQPHPVSRRQNQNIKSNNADSCQNQNVKPHAINSQNQNIKLNADSSCQTQKVKLHAVSSHDNQNLELLPAGSLQNRSTVIRDIIDGMINWDNVMHNLTGFTCLQGMSDFTGIVFSAYDYDEFMTVREYFSNTVNLNMLNSIINESMSNFEIPCRVKYVFHESFFDVPMRQIVKDYVFSHAKYVSHATNLKELIELVYEKFSLRDCMYLSVIVPKEEKKKICMKILVEYFTFVAILRIYDEYKKRTQLQ